MQLIQAEFSRKENGTTVRKIVWVDVTWGLKKGHWVRFEGEHHSSNPWFVTKVYKTSIEASGLNKKWGLELPKSQRTER